MMIENTTLKNVVIDLSKAVHLVTIEQYAFAYLTGVTEIIFNTSLEHIIGGGFAYNSSVETLTLPNSLENIGSDSFEGYSSLRTLTLGANLKEIGIRNFTNVDNLESITINSTIPTKIPTSRCFTKSSPSSPIPNIYYPSGTNYPNESGWSSLNVTNWNEQ